MSALAAISSQIGMDALTQVAIEKKDPLSDGTIAFGCITTQTLNSNSQQANPIELGMSAGATRYKRIESNNSARLAQGYINNGVVSASSLQIGGRQASDAYVSGCAH